MHYLPILFIVLLHLSSCDFIGQAEYTGTHPKTESDINLGTSIEGVHLGFTADEVKARLGMPISAALGDFAGFEYHYGSTSLPNLTVLFAEDYNNRVISIAVQNDYAGFTADRIGLTSQRVDVIEYLGTPDASELMLDWKRLGRSRREGDVYFHNGSVASILTYDDRQHVKTITLLLIEI